MDERQKDKFPPYRQPEYKRKYQREYQRARRLRKRIEREIEHLKSLGYEITKKEE